MTRIFKALSVGILMASAAFPQTSETKLLGLPDNLPPPPKVSVDLQPDSSLEVTAKTKWVNVNPAGIEIAIKIRNISSDKAVRAYATRTARTTEEPLAGCFLINVSKPGKVLQPGQSEVRSTWRGYPLDSRSPLPMFIDYVEFTDGTAWGPDVCKSAQYLAGARAGALALAERLQKVLDDGGAGAVMKTLKETVATIEAPPNESKSWQTGFFAGVNCKADSLRDAFSDGGLPEVEPAIKRPFDAAGYKIDVVKPESP
jgi:hypothetical protein